MDDGYQDGLREHDRADLAEKRVRIAQTALKHIRYRHPASGSAVKLALKAIEDARLLITDTT